MALLAGDGAIQEITGIKLHAWLRSVDLHHAAAGGFVHPGRQLQVARLSIDYKVVVVTAAECQLFVIIIDACANRYRPVFP